MRTFLLKITLSLLCSVFFLSLVQAQFVPLRKSSTLMHVAFPSTSTGYIITIDGTLHKTTNMGADWVEMPFISGSQLMPGHIQFLDDNTGFISVTNQVFKTSDGGVTWSANSTTTGSYIQGLHFIDATTGFLLSTSASNTGTVLKTTNGGSTWTTTTLPGTTDLTDIVFTDAQTGYISGTSGQLFKTIDAGATWNALTSGTTSMLTDLFFYGTTGYAVGLNSTLLKTSDAGATWSPVIIAGETIVGNVYFSDATTGYAYTNAGQRKTTDGGATWTNLPDYPIGQYLFVGSNFGVVLSGSLFITTDGGANWVANPYFSTLKGVHFMSASNGFAVGQYGTVLKTTNSGDNWTPQNINTTKHLEDIFFTDASTGFICGQDGLIMKTTDGGATWSSNSVSGTYWMDLHFANANEGYVVGANRTVAKTTNGGTTWTMVSPSSGFNDYAGVHTFGSGEAYAVGSGGTGVRINNSPLQPGVIATSANDQLFGVTFISPTNGFAVGANGVILRTTDGGQNWTEQQRGGLAEFLYNVQFIDSYNGFITGSTSFYQTTNGGDTWVPVTAPTPYLFSGSHMVNDQVYIVGQHGAIFRFDAVLNSASEALAVNKLTVYPNPSTGSFRIATDGITAQSAQLKLVDMLGRVVAEQALSLTGGQPEAEVSFEAKPGIYTVRLQTEKGVYSSRLILQ